MSLIPQLVDSGREMLISALSGVPLNFTKIKIGNGAEPESPSEGDFWYDTEKRTLFEYKEAWGESSRTITVGAAAPENPSENDLYYSTESGSLSYYGVGWVEDDSPISCSTAAPAAPATGDRFYDTANEILYLFSEKWNEKTGVPISCANTAPASPGEGEYWYDTANSALMKYEGTSWAADSQPFTYSDTAPASPSQGDWWYDTALHEFGVGWIPDGGTVFTYGSATPKGALIGDLWYDSGRGVLYSLGMLWILSADDSFYYGETEPARGYGGDLWYDSGNGVLKEYFTGWEASAQPFSYTTTAPATPDVGDLWYSTEEGLLYEYSGAQWSRSYVTLTCGVSSPATQDALTDLVNPILTVSITEISRGSNYVSLTGTFDNSELAAGFNWSETGVFAENSAGGEKLYAYCHTGELDEYIPANTSGRTVGTTLTLLVMVGDAEQVSASVGEGSVYATKKALEDHRRDYTNPHGVNAEQVGLGNVVNAAPADMAVEYTTPKALEEPESGETVGTVFGKLKKAINTFILHLKAINPHGITPGGIKAATADHKHSAADITSDILGTERGGTGCTSITELAEKISSMISAPVFGTYTGDGTIKRYISLDFTPAAVILCDSHGFGISMETRGGLAVGSFGVKSYLSAVSGHATSWNDSNTALLITSGGFYVNYYSGIRTNMSGEIYRFIAFR